MYNKEKMLYVYEDEEQYNEEAKGKVETKENLNEEFRDKAQISNMEAEKNKEIVVEKVTHKKKQVSNEENIYETIEYLIENMLEELNNNKKLYKHKYEHCKQYDKGIYERIYNKTLKHFRFLSDFYKEQYNKEYEPQNLQNYDYDKYNVERCIMRQYDFLDDNLRIYCNIENKKHKDMLNEIMQDIHRNMILLLVAYMGEE